MFTARGMRFFRPFGCRSALRRRKREEALKWFRDLAAVFARHGIGHSLWSYKQMDFGFADARMDGVREEILALL